MVRRFRVHDLRQTWRLDGLWDFAFLGDVDPETVDVGSIDFAGDRMAVPGCFDATPAYAGQRGLVAYRTRLVLRDATPHRLTFKGVHHWCRVFVDGERLAEHVGGFTRFNVDITGHEAGEVELVVLVDNRFDAERCPLHLPYFDWYHFGGITRPVTLQRLGATWIDRLAVRTVSLEPPTLGVDLTYKAPTPPGKTPLRVMLDGEPVVTEVLDLTETSGSLSYTLEVPDAALWSPEAPNLHMVHVQLGDDDMRERVGIRQITVGDQEIRINGKATRLLGVCRHQAHPQFGCALPEAIMVADVQQLRDLGCNFVRGSHYPQDERFLDLCDEAGICVWNEAIGWQHPAEHLTDPHFLDAQQAHIEEMVAMAANHASVIMWGLLNESHSHDPDCRPGYEALIGKIRALDPSRPVTYASNHPYEDVCLDLVDIVAVNCYPGWYVGDIASIPAYLDNVVAHLDSHGQADKPLIISEIGAGAIYGWRDMNETRWSEPYQAKLLDTVIRHLFEDRDRYAGLSLWQFCDCRSAEQTRRILGRPRGFNNKGLVDEYRRPKQGYNVVKAWYGKIE
jgi:beta-glucuronidase